MQLPFVVVKCEKIVSVLFEQETAKKNIFRCAKLNSENKFRSLRRATKGAALGARELLKKLDQNFSYKIRGARRAPHYSFIFQLPA